MSKRLLSGLVVLGMSFCTFLPSYANMINNDVNARGYAKRSMFSSLNDITGGKATYNGGWNHLLPISLTQTNNVAASLNKDMWVVLDETGSAPILDGCWIEALVKNGNYAPSSVNTPAAYKPTYKGYVIATDVANVQGGMDYTNYVYGTNPSSTAQTGGTVEIIKDPAIAARWIVKVNNVTALTLDGVTCRKLTGGLSNLKNVQYTPAGASQIDWGIETTDTANTFTQNTTITASRKLGTQGYTIPPATAMRETSKNTFGWYTSYDQNTGTITHTRP